MLNEIFELALSEKKDGVWGAVHVYGRRALARLSGAAERVWLSRWYFPLILMTAVAALAAGEYVGGAAVLLGISAAFMALCPDFLASMCPALLALLMTGPEYENLSVFLRCAPMAGLLIGATALHLAVWPVTVRVGNSSGGLLLVSVATLMGGADVLLRGATPNLLSLYYKLGLGAGMMILYVLCRSELRRQRKYELPVRFAGILFTAGLCMAAVVAVTYLRRWDEFREAGSVLEFSYRNFCATILLTTLPAPFYLALRRRAYLLGGAVLAVALLLTGSRSALLFGGILLLLCCGYLVRCGAVPAGKMAIVLLLAAAGLLLFGLDAVIALYQRRMSGGHLIAGGERRWQLLEQAWIDFWEHPILGVGLRSGLHKELFEGVPGSLFFYHNLPAQIAGSMGLLGLVAYLQVFCDRVRLLWRGRKDPFVAMLALSYAGMLMVSMTNPGVFCPFPNAGLLVLLFAVAEEHTGELAVPVRLLLPHRTRHTAVGVYGRYM